MIGASKLASATVQGRHPDIWLIGSYSRALGLPDRPVVYRQRAGAGTFELKYSGQDLPSGDTDNAPTVRFICGTRHPDADRDEFFVGMTYSAPFDYAPTESPMERTNRYVAARTTDGGSTWAYIENPKPKARFYSGVPSRSLGTGLDPHTVGFVDGLPGFLPIPDNPGAGLPGVEVQGYLIYNRALISPEPGVVMAMATQYDQGGTEAAHGTTCDGYSMVLDCVTSTNGADWAFGTALGSITVTNDPFDAAMVRSVAFTSATAVGKSAEGMLRYLVAPGITAANSEGPYVPFLSTDDAATFAQLATPLDRVNAAAWDSGGGLKRLLVAGPVASDERIYHTDDFTNWTQRHTSSSDEIDSLAARAGRIVATDVGRTTPTGWTGSAPGAGLTWAGEKNYMGRFYGLRQFGSGNQRPQVSTNDGQSFSDITLELPPGIREISGGHALRIEQIVVV